MLVEKVKSLKKYFLYFVLGLIFLFAGVIFFLIQKEWLVIQFTVGKSGCNEILSRNTQDTALRKKVNLYYWKDDKLLSEEFVLVWFSNKTENLKQLVNSWLEFMHDEKIIEKKVGLEFVALTQDDYQAYISFDKQILDKEWSTFKKWHLIESLIKTIYDSKLEVRQMFFLVGNQPMVDEHLDFSQGWPIEGFGE